MDYFTSLFSIPWINAVKPFNYSADTLLTLYMNYYQGKEICLIFSSNDYDVTMYINDYF